MLKLQFINAEKLMTGIGYVLEDLGIEIADGGVTVTVSETENAAVSVSLDGSDAAITFGGGAARFFRGLATLVQWLKEGETKKEISQTPMFKTNGAMTDVSRNAALNVNTVKAYMRKLALMGMNMFMLYTEDTYEIEGRPYFGHMRGRYTKQELKELDAYAVSLGIEMIPCIQTLGHLATHLRWGITNDYKDAPNVLLVGADATYELITDMIKTVKECFSSKRIHIGMDETFALGTGKYKFLNGERDTKDIYMEHLNRVYEIVTSFGLEPMMWSDMIFRISGKNLKGYRDYDLRVEIDKAFTERIPKGVRQVFWDYYRDDEEFYEKTLEKHQRDIDPDTVFAGAASLQHLGTTAMYAESLRNTIAALHACKKRNVKEVIATVWLDANDGLTVMSLAGMAWYADFDYTGEYNEESVKRTFEAGCGASYDALLGTEQIEYPHGGECGVCKCLLYNDPLIGLIDKNVEPIALASYYKKLTEELKAKQNSLGFFDAAYEVFVCISSLLENKADFGIRLKKAYDAKDIDALSALTAECDVIYNKIEALRQAHYNAWITYYKVLGWEVMDCRYGMLKTRYETAKLRLTQLIRGEVDHLEELDVERLKMHVGVLDEKNPLIDGRFMYMQYRNAISANIL